jgi:hypothetical protein
MVIDLPSGDHPEIAERRLVSPDDDQRRGSLNYHSAVVPLTARSPKRIGRRTKQGRRPATDARGPKFDCLARLAT